MTRLDQIVRLECKVYLALVLAATGAVYADTNDFSAVLGTGHDLTTSSWMSAEIDACEFCHDRDEASGEVLPSLNRSEPVSELSAYGVTRLGTVIDAYSDISAHCLSCHDGVTPLDAMGGVGGTNSFSMSELYPDSSAIFGTDFNAHHPTGVGIPIDQEYAEVSVIEGSNMHLINDRVECLTCHDVHGVSGNEKFLVRPNENGSLCLVCHTGK